MNPPHLPGDDVDRPDDDRTVAYEPATSAESAPGAGISGAFRYALVIERGPRAGLAYVLGPGETLAGRSEESDIFLSDVTVSRDHAKFTVGEDGLTVEDLGSTNGTYVNMERKDRAQLVPGDEVIIGKFHLVVARGDG